jgi:uncharacterized membrane protein (UPF0182 family)
VQNQFVSLPQVSQELNLLRQNQTTIDYGNLLTLPVAGGLLYVEPIYIERANQETSFPQLARVLVSFGGKVGYSARLDEALNQVFGPGATTGLVPPTPATPASPGTTPAPAAGGAGQPAASGELRAAVSDINAALSRLRAAQQSGDFAGQGAALSDLDKAVKRFNTAQNAAPTPGAPPAQGAAPPAQSPPRQTAPAAGG